MVDRSLKCYCFWSFLSGLRLTIRRVSSIEGFMVTCPYPKKMSLFTRRVGEDWIFFWRGNNYNPIVQFREAGTWNFITGLS